jgi:hypothetical protein
LPLRLAWAPLERARARPSPLPSNALPDSSFPESPWLFARATPKVGSASASPTLHRSGARTSERLSSPAGDEHGTPSSGPSVPERPFGAPLGRLEPATSELYSDRESVLDAARLGASPSRCSLDLWAPTRSTSSVVGLAPSPHVLAPPATAAPEDALTAGFTALQGVNPTEPGNRSEDRFQPPWGLQPLPIPCFPRTIASEPLIAF